MTSPITPSFSPSTRNELLRCDTLFKWTESGSGDGGVDMVGAGNPPWGKACTEVPWNTSGSGLHVICPPMSVRTGDRALPRNSACDPHSSALFLTAVNLRPNPSVQLSANSRSLLLHSAIRGLLGWGLQRCPKGAQQYEEMQENLLCR